MQEWTNRGLKNHMLQLQLTLLGLLISRFHIDFVGKLEEFFITKIKRYSNTNFSTKFHLIL